MKCTWGFLYKTTPNETKYKLPFTNYKIMPAGCYHRTDMHDQYDNLSSWSVWK